MSTRRIEFTPGNLKAIPAPDGPQIEYFDSVVPWLGLQVSAGGVKSFIYRYRPRSGPYRGKQRKRTLGRFSDGAKIGEQRALIAKAREQARGWRDKVQQGFDPWELERLEVEEHERQRRAAERTTRSYKQAVEEYVEKYAQQRKSNRTWEKTQRTLLAPKDWHSLNLSEIARADVHDFLDGYMGQGKGYMANRAYAALKTFFKWAAGREYVAVSPMLNIDRPFDGEKPRERHWKDDEIKSLWGAADALGSPERGFLKLLILLGQRKMEIAGMRREEVDFEANTWTLPGSRAKNKHDKIFPLSPLAVRILKAQPQIEGNPHFFPGKIKGESIKPQTSFTRAVRERSGITDFKPHDARHTLRTRLDQMEINGHKVPPHVKDACLNHTTQGVGAKHYSHYDYLKEQREVFETWAAAVEKLVNPARVVKIHG